MTEHKAGDTIVLAGTIVQIEGDVAVVRVDGALVDRGTVVVRLGKLPDDSPSEEDRIRDAMTEAMAHPGRAVTR